MTIFFLSVIVSFICLEASFLLDDFSVLYVANNSNANLPNYFKFALEYENVLASISIALDAFF